QEEAPSFRVPVLILRDKTERPEGVDAGLAQLVGMSSELIAASAISSLRNGLKQSINSSPNPYGDGKAAERIVDAILKRSHL
ncbi:MAG TPA: UDP-N-acetylglucosamine 2-epimerase, partial [Nitrosomonas sp.]|nr:UDP-N-acetylglucosamine 2-epimerase [Nitrosomonas sp.]